MGSINEAVESPPSSPTSGSPLSAHSQMKRQTSLRLVKTRTLKDSPRTPSSPHSALPEDEEVSAPGSGQTTPHSAGSDTTPKSTDLPVSPIKLTPPESNATRNGPPVPPRTRPTPPPRTNLFAAQTNGSSTTLTSATDEKSEESSVSSQEQFSSLSVPTLSGTSTPSQPRASLDDIETEVVALNSRKSLDLSIVLAWLKNITTESVAPLLDEANLSEISASVTRLTLASLAPQFGTFELSLLEGKLLDSNAHTCRNSILTTLIIL